MYKIDSFSGDYEFLSNFYHCPTMIEYKGRKFPTTEHAFQAAKCKNESDIDKFLECETPGQAKRLGRQIELRDDWEQVKVEIMTDVVRQKFQDEQLQIMLLKTGDAYLEEGNTWHDRFWGVCDGIGQNWLGRILMQIRSEFWDLKLNDNTLLQISYIDLKQMLDDFQDDGLNADGCSCSLHLDAEQEIKFDINNGEIKIL